MSTPRSDKALGRLGPQVHRRELEAWPGTTANPCAGVSGPEEKLPLPPLPSRVCKTHVNVTLASSYCSIRIARRGSFPHGAHKGSWVLLVPHLEGERHL
jgi:hypothetical protein